VIVLIGLAVGVDDSLFYLKRVREERSAGRTHQAAIEAGAATSGRAVVISGLTVMSAMAGMYLAGSATFVLLATGTIRRRRVGARLDLRASGRILRTPR
jgi:RND superfamily putative drug exporter